MVPTAIVSFEYKSQPGMENPTESLEGIPCLS